MKWIWIIILALICILAIGYAIQSAERPEINRGPRPMDTSSWRDFTSQDYSFSLRYPENWTSFSGTDFDLSPKFNFYPESEPTQTSPPFDHFVNINNVSIFPRGIPTEGYLVASAPVTFADELPFPIDRENSRSFMLESGEPFAIFIRPTELPEGWNQAGFILMRVRVNNLESVCLYNGQEVELSACSIPMPQGYSVVYRGRVNNQEIWETEKEIIKTIELN